MEMTLAPRNKTMSPDSTEEISPWEELHRERCALVLVDLVESVRLALDNPDDTARRWERVVTKVREQVLPVHGGRMVKSTGDGMLMTFARPTHAVAAALDLASVLAEVNGGSPTHRRLALRTGIHWAEVIVTDLDLFGPGPNLAARLASLAQPDDIIVSAEARDHLVPGLDADLEDLGDCWLKHIDGPVRAHRIRVAGPAPSERVVLQVLEPQVVATSGWGDLRPAIAVIPFAAGPEPEAQALGDLLANEVIAQLSPVPQLRVLSRLSTAALAQGVRDGCDPRVALDADYVLTGRVTSLGSRLLIQAELADARESAVLTTFRLTTTVDDLISDESPVAAELASGAAAHLLQRQLDMVRRCALPNLPGYALLLGGVGLMHRLSTRDFDRAGALLGHLMDRWPRLVEPMAWLARWHLFRLLQGWSDDPARDRLAAQSLSRRALDLNPCSSVALTVAGSIRTSLDHDLDGSQALYQAALDANPSDSFAWLLAGTAHAFRGNGVPAVQATRSAARLSPLDPMGFLYDCHAAGAAIAAEHYAEARDLAQRSLKANALHLSTLRVLAIAHVQLDEVEAARAAVSQLRRLDPQHSVERYLANSPAAAFPIGQLCARALALAGLPQNTP